MTVLALSLLHTARAIGPSKPNVLFVVIDDLGHDDVGFRSREIKTPVIDGLAAAGVVLENYYVQDVCSPSRATFMTGRYAMHHTIVDWIPPASAYGLPLNETTMAQMFGKAGYACHMSGKVRCAARAKLVALLLARLTFSPPFSLASHLLPMSDSGTSDSTSGA